MEVRISRSNKSHGRRCYGLSAAFVNLSTQATGCYSPNGHKDLRVNLTHSSGLLLTYWGIPIQCGLRILIRPGPQRKALGIGLELGPWRTDLNVGLRLERPGLYGVHGVLEYGTRSVTHKAEVRGWMRLESWCHIWADVGVVWDSVSSSLLVSVRCKGMGKLVWVQTRKIQGGVPHKTLLTVHGQAGEHGLKGSLGLEHQQDSLQCLLSVLQKAQKTEVSGILQHQWASLDSIIPKRVDFQGSGQLHSTSFSGNARFSCNTHTAQMDVTAAWEPSPSFRVTLQQNLASSVSPGLLVVSASTTANQAQFELESDVCSMLLFTNQHRGGEKRSTSWRVFLQQRCVLLKVREETRGHVQKLVSQLKQSKRNIFTLEMTLSFP